MTSIRVGTWNLDGYRQLQRAPRQIALLASLNADVLVLTEVNDTAHVPGMIAILSADGSPPYEPRNRAVGVYTRHAQRQVLEVTDPRLSTCVAIDLPVGAGRLIIYGTVIPWHQDGVSAKVAKVWERHRQAVRDVVADCARLASTYPSAHLVLAGDLNMNLDGTRWYGDEAAREDFVKGMIAAGLHCRTDEDIRVTRGADRAIVDHIWSTSGLAPVGAMRIWCAHKEDERLSDHNGVLCELSVQPA